MCTVTFSPTKNGYVVAMNRDDLYDRAITLPIRIVDADGKKRAYPKECNGGTWIGVNENAIAFSLLNWAIDTQSPKQQSRGIVIPNLLRVSSVGEAERLMSEMNFGGIWPFRLVGVFPDERTLTEWRWDGGTVKGVPCAWQADAWFSSGRSDAEAERLRRPVWKRMLERHAQADLANIRELHASHHPDSIPFSICVHRVDAGTLSYTEIVADKASVSISYSPVPPCQGIAFSSRASLSRPTL